MADERERSQMEHKMQMAERQRREKARLAAIKQGLDKKGLSDDMEKARKQKQMENKKMQEDMKAEWSKRERR